MKITPIVLLLVIVGFACRNEKFPAESAIFEKLKTARNDLDKYEAIVFIISSGCSGCISTAESLLINQCRQDDVNKILFVLTRYSSVKQARIRLGSDIIENDNVIVDTKNDYSNFLNQYPVVFFLDDGHLTDLSVIKPGAEESLFTKLNQLVN